MSRRTSAFGALTVLLSIGSLLVGTSPAHAELRKLATSYACTSEYGGGDTGVTVSVDLPDQVKAGREVEARRINFKITLPSELVGFMRDYYIEEVRASSDTARYRVGDTRVRIRNLVVPWTAVPASGPMVIKGHGRAAAFTIDTPGRYAVKVPASFTANVEARGSLGGAATDMTCALAEGAPAKLSTLQVVR